MKNLILFLLLVGFNACQSISIDPAMVGTWKLASISGGFSGNGYPANFTHLTLHSDKKYEVRQNGTVISSGTFRLENQDDKTVIKFRGDNLTFEHGEKFVVMNNSTLSLNEPCCDRYAYFFQQQED
jgi:hypothetical protein